MTLRDITLQFNDVTFRYKDSPEPVLRDVTARFPVGWTGIAGSNGAGKTTLLRLATGGLTPEKGSVHTPDFAVLCRQRTDDMPPDVAVLMAEYSAGAYAVRRTFGIGEDWHLRWETLSHGERKRAQLAAAFRRRPDVLAVDEPANHLDRDALDRLGDALAGYNGIGLIVTHDRALLDRLCGQCLFLENGTAVMRPGGYTEGVKQRDRERSHLRAQRRALDGKLKQLNRELGKRKQHAANADAERSKRHLARNDSDGRFRINIARLTGKDGHAGALFSQLEGRVARMEEERSGLFVPRKRAHGIVIDGTRSHRDVLAHIPPGSTPVPGGDERIEHPDLIVRADSRIAVAGPNGSGKSTLIRRLMDGITIPPERVLYIPQELSAGYSRRIAGELRATNAAERGDTLTIVARLGSDPGRILAASEPSPGETRKLALAQGMARSPALIVMDEPTNHLDIISVEAIEEALGRCECALVLVSHDHRFLDALAVEWWTLSCDGGTRRLRIT